MTVTLEKAHGSSDWLRMYGLYVTAFPPAERKPFSIIRKMYAQERADVWVIRKDGKFAGFATTVNGGDLILLDYLAVRKSCRGNGIGSAAMEKLMQRYCDQGFFVEIESTRVDCPDLPLRQKRRHFYEAAGMMDLGVSAQVFGVKMDLLGIRCTMTFDDYRGFYHDHYSPRAAQHLEPME
jgi:GNAT superfamily N-acetyltransferase